MQSLTSSLSEFGEPPVQASGAGARLRRWKYSLHLGAQAWAVTACVLLILVQEAAPDNRLRVKHKNLEYYAHMSNMILTWRTNSQMHS